MYYHGWGALVDNKRTIISYDNPGGLMRVAIPVGDHQVFMAFRETGERFLADLISGVFIIMYIALFLIPPAIKKWTVLIGHKKRHI